MVHSKQKKDTRHPNVHVFKIAKTSEKEVYISTGKMVIQLIPLMLDNSLGHFLYVLLYYIVQFCIHMHSICCQSWLCAAYFDTRGTAVMQCTCMAPGVRWCNSETDQKPEISYGWFIVVVCSRSFGLISELQLRKSSRILQLIEVFQYSLRFLCWTN